LVLAALIVVAGFLIFGWTVFSAISGIGGDFFQMTAPGTKDFDLSEVGEYTIFYENLSVVGGRLYSTECAVPSGLEIEVTELSSGEKVDLSLPKGSTSYSFGGRSGRSIAAFAIDHPGVYRVAAWYSQGREGPEVVLAVGHGFFEKVISAVLVSSAVLFGSVIIASHRPDFGRQEKTERRGAAPREDADDAGTIGSMTSLSDRGRVSGQVLSSAKRTER
jgi:hypothetical protein